MNMSQFAFNVLLTFIPGIICAYIIDMFTTHKEITQFKFVMNAYLLGFISYVIYASLVYLCAPDQVQDITFIKSLSSTNPQISLKEILIVCAVSITLGSLIVILDYRKLHFKLFQKLGFTHKFGELDVWGYLMNAKNTEWITVRDFENNLMYDGCVTAFSDNAKDAELLLGDVSVYRNDTGIHLYDVSVQYLCLERTKISIEIRTANEAE